LQRTQHGKRLPINDGNGGAAILVAVGTIRVSFVSNIDTACSGVEGHPFRLRRDGDMGRHAVGVAINDIQLLACRADDIDSSRGLIDAQWLHRSIGHGNVRQGAPVVFVDHADAILSAVRHVQPSQAAVDAQGLWRAPGMNKRYCCLQLVCAG